MEYAKLVQAGSHLLVVNLENHSSVLFSLLLPVPAMRELCWIVILYIAMLFSVLKRNPNDWSWHNHCILLSIILLQLFIAIYLYTRNNVITKQITEIIAMYQTALATVALDIGLGLLITCLCVLFLCYIMCICYNSFIESDFLFRSKGC